MRTREYDTASRPTPEDVQAAIDAVRAEGGAVRRWTITKTSYGQWVVAIAFQGGTK